MEVSYGLTVDSDPNKIAQLLKLAASQFEWSEIPKDKVIIGP